MQKFGFFNAKLQNGVYDRTYNANDYSDNLAIVISNGVLRSKLDDLKVTASGMNVSVDVGRAWIKGHYYINDSEYTFPAVTASTNGARIDRVMLRLNNDIDSRSILLTYVQGTAGDNPQPPEPVRDGNIYDLVLADIYVGATASSVTVTDQRDNADICGWVYSVSGDNSFFTSLDNSFYEWFKDVKDDLASVTLFKRYQWRTVLTTATNQIQFDIPQFDEDTCFIEVYINGLLDTEGVEYTRSGNVLTGLGLPLVAGTEVEVKCYKSIDGTGIMSVADEITELQNQMSQVQGNAKYTYVCTGLNDNLYLSQIAQVILQGLYNPDVLDYPAPVKAFLDNIGNSQYFGSLPDDAQIGIDVVGDLGVTTPYAGNGTSASPYRWFSLGNDNAQKRRILFNFDKCNKIKVNCATNTTNYIFYGTDLNIANVQIEAAGTASGCAITMIKGATNSGRINADNCRFVINASAAAQISEHGTFTNCYAYIVSDNSTAYCFKPKSTGLIRLNGGEFYAYGKTTSGIGSAISHTSESDTDAVLIAVNIHCPVVTKTNYSQGFLSVANAGKTYINGVVSRLNSSGSYNEIVGLIAKNKA